MALGLIGRKLGMTQVYTAQGELIPVTVVQAGPCTVVQVKTRATDGYAAVQLGFGEKKPQRATKGYRGHCLKAGKGVFETLREFRVEGEDESFTLGHELLAEQLFNEGDVVDVSGVSKGRGFTGVIKRHRFGGFPASHGTHEYFRHGGAIGNRSYPGRVFKGKRMAGQYGAETVTVQSLKVVAVRAADHVILLSGAVPGARGGLLVIRPAVKVTRDG